MSAIVASGQTPRGTAQWPGRYERPRRRLASSSPTTFSAAGSKWIVRPRRVAMFPRWHSAVDRNPISISAAGARPSRTAVHEIGLVAAARRELARDRPGLLRGGRTPSRSPSCRAASSPRCRRRCCRSPPPRAGRGTRSASRRRSAAAGRCRCSGYSKATVCVSGNCWSSSKKYLPPTAATVAGWSSTPRPQRAMSSSWTPSFPMSPVPKSYHQCQV